MEQHHHHHQPDPRFIDPLKNLPPPPPASFPIASQGASSPIPRSHVVVGSGGSGWWHPSRPVTRRCAGRRGRSRRLGRSRSPTCPNPDDPARSNRDDFAHRCPSSGFLPAPPPRRPRPAHRPRLLDLFTRAVSARQRRRARRSGAVHPRTASVNAAQRFGSAISLNVHFHLQARPTRTWPRCSGPSSAGPRVSDCSSPRTTSQGAEEDALAGLQAAEVDRRIRFPAPCGHARRSAHLDGFSPAPACASTRTTARGWSGSAATPSGHPSRFEHLSQGPDGRLVYRMKRARGGSLFLVLTPDELPEWRRCSRLRPRRGGAHGQRRPALRGTRRRDGLCHLGVNARVAAPAERFLVCGRASTEVWCRPPEPDAIRRCRRHGVCKVGSAELLGGRHRPRPAEKNVYSMAHRGELPAS